MNRLPYLLLLWGLLTAAPLTTTGCSGSDADPADEGPPVEGAADAHAEGESHAEPEGEHAEGTEVALTPVQMQEGGIRVAPVTARELSTPLILPARIVSSEMGRAEAGALVGGRIARLFAAEGAGVRRGAPLAEIESAEVAALQGDYLTAQANVQRAQAGIERSAAAIERAQAALTREEQLARENLTARSEVEEAREGFRVAQADRRAAQAEVAAARAEVAALGAQLRAIGSAPPTRGINARVTVRAPIGGVVAGRTAVLGDYVESNESLYEIVAPGAVYADAEVSPDVAGAIRPGTGAVIVARDGTRYRGEVAFVAPQIEAETRTARVRLRVLNATAALRPETFVTVELEGADGRQALVVPPDAIERAGGDTFVYRAVEGEPNTFERVPVELGEATAEAVEVTNGLAADDVVVVEGVFFLKSVRQRGELSEHEH